MEFPIHVKAEMDASHASQGGVDTETEVFAQKMGMDTETEVFAQKMGMDTSTSPERRRNKETDTEMEVQADRMANFVIGSGVAGRPASPEHHDHPGTAAGREMHGEAPSLEMTERETLGKSVLDDQDVGKDTSTDQDMTAAAIFGMDGHLDSKRNIHPETKNDASKTNQIAATFISFERLPKIETTVRVDEEAKAILEPVQAQMEKLGSPLPPENLRLKIKSPMQIIKERLLPIGEYIMAYLDSLPASQRGATELRLCKYMAAHHWPLHRANDTSPPTALHIQEIYRNALYKRSLVPQPSPPINTPPSCSPSSSSTSSSSTLPSSIGSPPSLSPRPNTYTSSTNNRNHVEERKTEGGGGNNTRPRLLTKVTNTVSHVKRACTSGFRHSGTDAGELDGKIDMEERKREWERECERQRQRERERGF